jgi:outer membrane protein TolC
VQNRPEVKALKPLRASLDAQLKLARNDRKPSLDLTLSPGYDTGDGAIGSTAKLGVVYSAPLRQNTADGRIAETEAKLRKFDADTQLLVQTIRNEVDDAVSAVRTSAERVKVAEEELALAKRLEQAERDRFEIGEGTLFLLNQRERGTAEAAVRWIDVLAEHQQALVALRAAAGEL